MSRALEDWAFARGVQLDFIRPGKPQAKIDAWRLDYNQRRPHGSLGHLTPDEYARQRQLTLTADAAFL